MVGGGQVWVFDPRAVHPWRPALPRRRSYLIAFPVYPPGPFVSSSLINKYLNTTAGRSAVVLVRRRAHRASVRCIRSSRWDRQGGTRRHNERQGMGRKARGGGRDGPRPRVRE